jgi:B-box zinc finger
MNCATHNDIAAVAFCRTCGKPLCQTCTRDVRGVIYCENCLAARIDGTQPSPGYVPPAQAGFTPVIQPPNTTASDPVVAGAMFRTGGTLGSSGPNPAVAGILAGFFPFGVGAVYCSQYAKGLAHLVIMILLIIGVGSNLPWYMTTMLGIGIGFFYVYQIIDAVRTAHALQMGQPAPDPFGLAQTFGTGEKLEGTKVPAGAAILIGLGVLFLLHTAGLFEIGMGLFVSLILIFLGVWLFARQWGLVGPGMGRCRCERCRTRRLMGPAILTTVGVLMLLDTTSRVGIDKTWPAILLVIGVVKLLQSNASWEGHVGPLPPGQSGFPPNTPTPPAVQPGPEQPGSAGEVKNV